MVVVVVVVVVFLVLVATLVPSLTRHYPHRRRMELRRWMELMRMDGAAAVDGPCLVASLALRLRSHGREIALGSPLAEPSTWAPNPRRSQQSQHTA